MEKGILDEIDMKSIFDQEISPDLKRCLEICQNSYPKDSWTTVVHASSGKASFYVEIPFPEKDELIAFSKFVNAYMECLLRQETPPTNKTEKTS